ncbi:uncharacterized protein LOC111481975 [Cucurbita maxima]|uniref:Uncharacterized protein LOC111481975 n=1 Tax=Cucurbita maxima TaxID=3661 RepID=A0A6J1J7K1_CUCMA|nr:uncharacterized protein LOC111481975 [Cucurbita maxima]
MASERRITRSSTFRWVSRKFVLPEPDMAGIGFLSFEIAPLMSKLVQLWNRLEDEEFMRVKQQISNSKGIEILISNDEQFLMELLRVEIVGDLQYIAKSIARFGDKCSDPVLHKFEKFVEDPMKNEFDWGRWQYRWEKMERRVKKMQKFIVFTAELSREMEVLAAVERNLGRNTTNFSFAGGGGKSFNYRKEISWHRRRVQSLKLLTPWNRTFDYILRLFMRSIITITQRIKIVFGVNEMWLPEDSGKKITGRRIPADNCRRSKVEEQGKKQSYNRSPPLMKNSAESKRFSQFPHFRSFRDCKYGATVSPPPSQQVRKTSSLKLKNTAVENRVSSSLRRINGGHYSISSFFIKENLPSSPPNSLGAAALSIHYGKIVTLIEQMASAPRLIGSKERDKLYNMLPLSIRKALRSRLRKAAKIRHSSLYDPVLAAEWKSATAKILQWLTSMAHDMETWHSEHSVEKKPNGGDMGGSKPCVLLLQTLHYADREKTEGAIVEVLVALSNICSSNEVHEQRLLKGFGVEADESYLCRNYGFSCFDVLAL